MADKRQAIKEALRGLHYGPTLMVYCLRLHCWYCAHVVRVDGDMLKIRYRGWESSEDEEIHKLSDRLDCSTGGRKKWKGIKGAAGAFLRVWPAWSPTGAQLEPAVANALALESAKMRKNEREKGGRRAQAPLKQQQQPQQQEQQNANRADASQAAPSAGDDTSLPLSDPADRSEGSEGTESSDDDGSGARPGGSNSELRPAKRRRLAAMEGRQSARSGPLGSHGVVQHDQGWAPRDTSNGGAVRPLSRVPGAAVPSAALRGGYRGGVRGSGRHPGGLPRRGRGRGRRQQREEVQDRMYDTTDGESSASGEEDEEEEAQEEEDVAEEEEEEEVVVRFQTAADDGGRGTVTWRGRRGRRVSRGRYHSLIALENRNAHDLDDSGGSRGSNGGNSHGGADEDGGSGSDSESDSLQGDGDWVAGKAEPRSGVPGRQGRGRGRGRGGGRGRSGSRGRGLSRGRGRSRSIDPGTGAGAAEEVGPLRGRPRGRTRGRPPGRGRRGGRGRSGAMPRALPEEGLEATDAVASSEDSESGGSGSRGRLQRPIRTRRRPRRHQSSDDERDLEELLARQLKQAAQQREGDGDVHAAGQCPREGTDLPAPGQPAARDRGTEGGASTSGGALDRAPGAGSGSGGEAAVEDRSEAAGGPQDHKQGVTGVRGSAGRDGSAAGDGGGDGDGTRPGSSGLASAGMAGTEAARVGNRTWLPPRLNPDLDVDPELQPSCGLLPAVDPAMASQRASAPAATPTPGTGHAAAPLLVADPLPSQLPVPALAPLNREPVVGAMDSAMDSDPTATPCGVPASAVPPPQLQLPRQPTPEPEPEMLQLPAAALPLGPAPLTSSLTSARAPAAALESLHVTAPLDSSLEAVPDHAQEYTAGPSVVAPVVETVVGSAPGSVQGMDDLGPELRLADAPGGPAVAGDDRNQPPGPELQTQLVQESGGQQEEASRRGHDFDHHGDHYQHGHQHQRHPETQPRGQPGQTQQWQPPQGTDWRVEQSYRDEQEAAPSRPGGSATAQLPALRSDVVLPPNKMQGREVPPEMPAAGGGLTAPGPPALGQPVVPMSAALVQERDGTAAAATATGIGSQGVHRADASAGSTYAQDEVAAPLLQGAIGVTERVAAPAEPCVPLVRGAGDHGIAVGGSGPGAAISDQRGSDGGARKDGTAPGRVGSGGGAAGELDDRPSSSPSVPACEAGAPARPSVDSRASATCTGSGLDSRVMAGTECASRNKGVEAMEAFTRVAADAAAEADAATTADGDRAEAVGDLSAAAAAEAGAAAAAVDGAMRGALTGFDKTVSAVRAAAGVTAAAYITGAAGGAAGPLDGVDEEAAAKAHDAWEAADENAEGGTGEAGTFGMELLGTAEPSDDAMQPQHHHPGGADVYTPSWAMAMWGLEPEPEFQNPQYNPAEDDHPLVPLAVVGAAALADAAAMAARASGLARDAVDPAAAAVASSSRAEHAFAPVAAVWERDEEEAAVADASPGRDMDVDSLLCMVVPHSVLLQGGDSGLRPGGAVMDMVVLHPHLHPHPHTILTVQASQHAGEEPHEDPEHQPERDGPDQPGPGLPLIGSHARGSDAGESQEEQATGAAAAGEPLGRGSPPLQPRPMASDQHQAGRNGMDMPGVTTAPEVEGEHPLGPPLRTRSAVTETVRPAQHHGSLAVGEAVPAGAGTAVGEDAGAATTSAFVDTQAVEAAMADSIPQEAAEPHPALASGDGNFTQADAVPAAAAPGVPMAPLPHAADAGQSQSAIATQSAGAVAIVEGQATNCLNPEQVEGPKPVPQGTLPDAAEVSSPTQEGGSAPEAAIAHGTEVPALTTTARPANAGTAAPPGGLSQAASRLARLVAAVREVSERLSAAAPAAAALTARGVRSASDGGDAAAGAGEAAGPDQGPDTSPLMCIDLTGSTENAAEGMDAGVDAHDRAVAGESSGANPEPQQQSTSQALPQVQRGDRRKSSRPQRQRPLEEATAAGADIATAITHFNVGALLRIPPSLDDDTQLQPHPKDIQEEPQQPQQPDAAPPPLLPPLQQQPQQQPVAAHQLLEDDAHLRAGTRPGPHTAGRRHSCGTQQDRGILGKRPNPRHVEPPPLPLHQDRAQQQQDDLNASAEPTSGGSGAEVAADTGAEVLTSGPSRGSAPSKDAPAGSVASPGTRATASPRAARRAEGVGRWLRSVQTAARDMPSRAEGDHGAGAKAAAVAASTDTSGRGITGAADHLEGGAAGRARGAAAAAPPAEEGRTGTRKRPGARAGAGEGGRADAGTRLGASGVTAAELKSLRAQLEREQRQARSLEQELQSERRARAQAESKCKALEEAHQQQRQQLGHQARQQQQEQEQMQAVVGESSSLHVLAERLLLYAMRLQGRCLAASESASQIMARLEALPAGRQVGEAGGSGVGAGGSQEGPAAAAAAAGAPHGTGSTAATAAADTAAGRHDQLEQMCVLLQETSNEVLGALLHVREAEPELWERLAPHLPAHVLEATRPTAIGRSKPLADQFELLRARDADVSALGGQLCALAAMVDQRAQVLTAPAEAAVLAVMPHAEGEPSAVLRLFHELPVMLPEEAILVLPQSKVPREVLDVAMPLSQPQLARCHPQVPVQLRNHSAQGVPLPPYAQQHLQGEIQAQLQERQRARHLEQQAQLQQRQRAADAAQLRQQTHPMAQVERQHQDMPQRHPHPPPQMIRQQWHPPLPRSQLRQMFLQHQHPWQQPQQHEPQPQPPDAKQTRAQQQQQQQQQQQLEQEAYAQPPQQHQQRPSPLQHQQPRAQTPQQQRRQPPPQEAQQPQLARRTSPQQGMQQQPLQRQHPAVPPPAPRHSEQPQQPAQQQWQAETLQSSLANPQVITTMTDNLLAALRRSRSAAAEDAADSILGRRARVSEDVPRGLPVRGQDSEFAEYTDFATARAVKRQRPPPAGAPVQQTVSHGEEQAAQRERQASMSALWQQQQKQQHSIQEQQRQQQQQQQQQRSPPQLNAGRREAQATCPSGAAIATAVERSLQARRQHTELQQVNQQQQQQPQQQQQQQPQLQLQPPQQQQQRQQPAQPQAAQVLRRGSCPPSPRRQPLLPTHEALELQQDQRQAARMIVVPLQLQVQVEPSGDELGAGPAAQIIPHVVRPTAQGVSLVSAPTKGVGVPTAVAAAARLASNPGMVRTVPTDGVMAAVSDRGLIPLLISQPQSKHRQTQHQQQYRTHHTEPALVFAGSPAAATPGLPLQEQPPLRSGAGRAAGGGGGGGGGGAAGGASHVLDAAASPLAAQLLKQLAAGVPRGGGPPRASNITVMPAQPQGHVRGRAVGHFATLDLQAPGNGTQAPGRASGSQSREYFYQDS